MNRDIKITIIGWLLLVALFSFIAVSLPSLEEASAKEVIVTLSPVTVENSSKTVSVWDINGALGIVPERIVMMSQNYISPIEIPEPVKEPEPTPPPRYGFTDDDVYLLAQLLCGSGTRDGDGEYDIDFQREINYFEVCKVLDVVMDRVRSGEFPNTVYGVVMEDGQFSVMPWNSYKTPSDKALKVVGDWCKAYDAYDPGVQVVPEDHLYFTGNGYINITR